MKRFFSLRHRTRDPQFYGKIDIEHAGMGNSRGFQIMRRADESVRSNQMMAEEIHSYLPAALPSMHSVEC